MQEASFQQTTAPRRMATNAGAQAYEAALVQCVLGDHRPEILEHCVLGEMESLGDHRPKILEHCVLGEMESLNDHGPKILEHCVLGEMESLSDHRPKILEHCVLGEMESLSNHIPKIPNGSLYLDCATLGSTS
ncbi:hypothetical protein NDU88_001295 [Pleurodeles waltl]|uniref:Uncharacterized protein n=1 Tax=Pleurodeles waltl TaxID=8319 RepID=A0AAV7V7E0_PLEWA|nr:hypothetical protein NDU88_001295 [Pleurodeles waltl]